MAKDNLFHTFEVAGVTFVGLANGPEPWLARMDGREVGRGVSLGSALIIERVTEQELVGKAAGREPGFYVCKYGSEQPRISLIELDVAQILQLAAEFGIDCGPSLRDGPDFPPRFFDTPAGLSLLSWSRRHPRLAKHDAARAPYLREWPALL